MAVHHILLLKYKPDTAAADIEKVRTTLRSLPSAFSSIVKIKAGNKIKHPLDQDYDEGIVLVFKDEDALKEYIANKTQREYQMATEPYIQDKLIFDYKVEE